MGQSVAGFERERGGVKFDVGWDLGRRVKVNYTLEISHFTAK